MNAAHEAQPLFAVVSRCAWTLHAFRLPLIRAIAAAGNRVVAIGQPLGGFEIKLTSQGVHFLPAPPNAGKLSIVADLRLLLRLTVCFARMRPCLVHAFTIRPAIFATLAAWLARVPVRIVTITGLGHAFTTAHAPTRWVAERLYRLALGRADVVFFQNPDDRALFIERRLVRADRTRLVPGSGVDVDRFSPVPLPMSKGGAPTFLMIARLLREKGVHEYLAAAAVVKSRFPEARFLLVGGADPRNPSSLTAVELDALGRSQHVTWVGEVEDVRPWIGQSDVVVLPSYREGVPRSLLEGAAMGRALIATDVPGCREVVQHELTGLLVPSKDVHSLAAAMQRLIESPQLVLSLAQRARMKAVAEFSEHLVIDATLRAYDEMLAPAQEGSRA